jgi:ubiquinone/menaquinone biosynthesis C-methylase UbiE
MSLLWNRIRWTLYAPAYDTFVRFHAQRRRSLSLLHPRDHDHILVAGCGTGSDLPLLPSTCRITAVDLTAAMVRRARERGVPAQVAVMDAARLAFPDATFDAVVLHLILAVMPDPYGCIREVERVLKPGGRAVVFDKFLQPGRVPSLFRRAVSVPVRLLATHINRSAEDIAAASRLRITHDEPALLGDLFRILRLEK